MKVKVFLILLVDFTVFALFFMLQTVTVIE